MFSKQKLNYSSQMHCSFDVNSIQFAFSSNGYFDGTTVAANAAAAVVAFVVVVNVVRNSCAKIV